MGHHGRKTSMAIDRKNGMAIDRNQMFIYTKFKGLKWSSLHALRLDKKTHMDVLQYNFDTLW